MDEEKARAYVELASKMTELHASIALLTQNVDKMARTDAEVTSMTKIFQGVYVCVTIWERLTRGEQQHARWWRRPCD